MKSERKLRFLAEATDSVLHFAVLSEEMVSRVKCSSYHRLRHAVLFHCAPLVVKLSPSHPTIEKPSSQASSPNLIRNTASGVEGW